MPNERQPTIIIIMMTVIMASLLVPRASVRVN